MKYLTPLLAAVPLLFAQTPYVWEGFNDGNADGWVIWPSYTDAEYEVTDSLTFHMYSDQSAADWAMVYWDIEMPEADYTMLTDFISHSPATHIGLSGRLGMDGSAYTAYANNNQNLITIGKYDSAQNWFALQSVPFYYDYETWYQMKFQIVSDTMRVKVWERGMVEPDWMNTVTDSEFPGPGYFAVECGHYPTGIFSAEFDNIMVAGSIPEALTQMTWAGIKSSFW